jgi:hypothetical protein
MTKTEMLELLTSSEGQAALAKAAAAGVYSQKLGRTQTSIGTAIQATNNGVAALLADRNDTDEPEIARLVLAGLEPSVIAAAIPADFAQQVVNELSARLRPPS